jgi:hypothetical protein
MYMEGTTAQDASHTTITTAPLTTARQTNRQRCQHILEVLLPSLSRLPLASAIVAERGPGSNFPHCYPMCAVGCLGVGAKE